jgi:hypothetical protein
MVTARKLIWLGTLLIGAGLGPYLVPPPPWCPGGVCKGDVIVNNDVCLYRAGASWLEIQDVSGGVCGGTRGTLSGASLQSWNSASAVNTAGVALASTADVNWSSTAAMGGTKDVGLERVGAKILRVTDGLSGAGAAFHPGTVAFAALGTPANGTITYCSDCTIAGTCAGSGTGALAKRLNGVWVCN